MNVYNPQVEDFLSKTKRWTEELIQLRRIILSCGLEEDFKWRNPCYTFQGNNIIILGEFKEYCAFSFFKGALLGDPEHLLQKPGENSQSTRLIKFTNVAEILRLEPILNAYIFEALEVEKAGLKVALKSNSELDFAVELLEKMEQDVAFKTAFEALTPGRQRAYNMFFTAAKQSETRLARIGKYEQRILSGKGINDCVCGLSKKMPGCDGSHKYLVASSI
jgi:uncharacterized protein YdeI (YjbR/CyaY-like superfamily)